MNEKYDKAAKTAWQEDAAWYDGIVGEEGHYYHRNVIFPKLISLLKPSAGDKILDLACGQGAFARALPGDVFYLGIDGAPDLIASAQKAEKNDSKKRFLIGDVTRPLATEETDFDAVTMILALQNVARPDYVIANAAKHLKAGGRAFFVLNHPYFRIPKMTSWLTDEEKDVQARRVDGYLMPRKIGIDMHPGQAAKSETASYHTPLVTLVKFLRERGFAVTHVEEWTSDKTSEGKHAARENAARAEFPLFMCLGAVKLQ